MYKVIKALKAHAGKVHPTEEKHLKAEVTITKRIKNPDGAIKCQWCSYATDKNKYLTLHMPKTNAGGVSSEERAAVRRKNRPSSPKKLYQCEICHDGFSNKHGLEVHYGKHENKEPYLKKFRASK
jgi:hypothetical protein